MVKNQEIFCMNKSTKVQNPKRKVGFRTIEKNSVFDKIKICKYSQKTMLKMVVVCYFCEKSIYFKERKKDYEKMEKID